MGRAYGSGSGLVLVVDDEADVRGLIVDVLQCEGYEACAARDGRAALAAAARRPPDVVALELVLHDADGVEVARQLLARAPRVRFVFVSALLRRGAQAARQFSAAFVPKPFRVDQLSTAVRDAFAASRA
ncbi:MAG TPA: response regulator [Myxococcota bacterium]|jgi:two-component system OmpR family response regulator|nr:response regulator [Myxococcota bacterium]